MKKPDRHHRPSVFSYPRPPQTPIHPRWRTVARVAIASVVVYLLWGAFPDRSFEISKLRGLTPRQVITQFGKPRMKWWGAGNLFFLYDDSWRWRAFRYSIIFKGGHVVKVSVGEL